MPTIRKANLNDALQLALVAEKTFRATFGAVNAEQQMSHHCKNSYSEEIQATEISDPNRITLLCEDNENLIGFAQLR